MKRIYNSDKTAEWIANRILQCQNRIVRNMNKLSPVKQTIVIVTICILFLITSICAILKK